MNDIDKWYAEQCGVNYNDNGWCENVEFPTWCTTRWTIKDPRCREVCREGLEITTDRLNKNISIGFDKWCAYDERGEIVCSGKTIADAEIACLIAIYEARYE